MELNNDLITQFAKITKFNTGKSATTVRGTIRKSDDRNYIQIDGADEGSMTPVETVVEIADGDRVIATVKDHSVIVTGNKSDPSVGTKTADGLRSSITQTADQIRLEVANEVKGLNSSIELTAGQIRSEVKSATDGLSSSITQTAKDIRSEVTDSINGVNTKITQTADAIKSEVISTVDDKYSEVKQTVDGLTITTVNGKTTIDGGNISTTNLNLTGAITWSDLSSGAKNTINSVADDAEARANEAYELAEEAKDLAANSGIELPEYIKSTYIDFSSVESPYIIGGYIYAVGTTPGDEATFTTMDENGFYLYHNSVTPDNDDSVYPKICLNCSDDGEEVYCILGSGAADDSETYNRFYIEKTSNYVSLRYVIDYNGNTCGFYLYRDGAIRIDADTVTGSGISALADALELERYPVGSIYLAFNHTSPASFFGGSWTRLNGYFLYAGGSSATMGDTGNVVTAGGTNTALFIKIAAWRRIS